MKKIGYVALTTIFILTLFVSGCVDQGTIEISEKNITPWKNLENSPLKFVGMNERFDFDHENKSFSPSREIEPLKKDPEIFIEDIITKSEITALQIEETINNLEADGKDVEKLKGLLESYDRSIKRARENQRLAHDTEPVTQINKRYYLHQALQEINEANKILKEIFDELKIISPGSVELNLTDSISADGNGTAILSGELNISIYAEEGRLAVSDYEGNLNIVIDTDHETFFFFDENQNTSIYKGFNGSANISGSNLMVMIRGSKISFTASGQGKIMMSGNGTYNFSTINDQTEQGQWMTAFHRI